MPGFVSVLTGPEYVFEYVNEAYIDISERKDFVGLTIREVFPDLAGQGFYELLDRVYATGETVVTRGMELHLHGGDEAQYIDFVYEPIRGETGEVTGIFVGGYEITEAHRATVALRASEERYRALVRLTDELRDLGDPADIQFTAAAIFGETLNVSRVGYGTIDPDAETLHVERDWTAPRVETLAGVVPLREYGSFIDSLKRGEFIAIADARLDPRTDTAAAALEGRSARSFVNVPVVEQGRLVAVLYVNHAEARAWTDEELAFIREAALRRSEARLREANETLELRVEERTRDLMEAEAALRQAQKMEAVGQLTGGIAHDFNNLLAGIAGSLELLEKRLAEGRLGGVERYIDVARASTRRATALTQRLLAFSRRQTLDPRPTDINRLVAGMEELIRRTVGPSIEVEVVGAGGLWLTRVDSSQLENAMLNLAINARDAMPDGGRITIETANKWLDHQAAKGRELTPGQYVSLSVSDTGTGMTADVVSHAFEPFFTTKPLGEGTGLGLSMIHGFVRQSGGQVQIYSEVGQGTTIGLYLPRFAGDLDAADAPDNPGGAGAGQGETVLVIDDEEPIRMLIMDVLEEAGYRVLTAADGPAGLKILRSDARIDLLITDVGLPGGVNGRQVADAARISRPGLKVLFITGYAENAAVGNGLLAAGMQVITKSFAMATLGARVRDIIKG